MKVLDIKLTALWLLIIGESIITRAFGRPEAFGYFLFGEIVTISAMIVWGIALWVSIKEGNK